MRYDIDKLRKKHDAAIGGTFISKQRTAASDAADPIAHTRTLIRHDADAIAKQLMRIYFR